MTLVLDTAFFIGCIVLMSHMFFSSFNYEVKKTIIISSLLYGTLILIPYLFTHRNTPNYGISIGSTIGGSLGFIAGLYLGYKVCLFARILDDIQLIELSAGSFAIGYTFAEFFRLIGSNLGNILINY